MIIYYQLSLLTKVIENQGDCVREVSSRHRSAWLKSINRKDWTPGPGVQVCSCHFITNKASSLIDESNPDWVPTLRVGHEVSISDFSQYEHSKRKSLCPILPEVVTIDDEH